MADATTYGAEVVARVMDQRPATIKRNVKNGVLTSHWGDGRHTFDARDVQFYMLRKGRGSVPLNVVEQLLELAATATSHAKPEPTPTLVDHANGAPRGRPPFPPGIARDHVIRLRVTQAEHERIGLHASAAGVTVSEHCRKRILTGML